MQKLSLKSILIKSLIELISLLIIGFIAIYVYGYPLIFNRFAVLIVSLGLSAILMYNVIQYKGLKYFFILVITITIILTPTLFRNFTFLSTMHHAFKIFILGVIVYILWMIIPAKDTSGNLILNIVLWIIAFIVFFVIFYMFTGFILKIRQNISGIEISKQMIRALKFGSVLGIGIGIGQLLSSRLMKK